MKTSAGASEILFLISIPSACPHLPKHETHSKRKTLQLLVDTNHHEIKRGRTTYGHAKAKIQRWQGAQQNKSYDHNEKNTIETTGTQPCCCSAARKTCMHAWKQLITEGGEKRAFETTADLPPNPSPSTNTHDKCIHVSEA